MAPTNTISGGLTTVTVPVNVTFWLQTYAVPAAPSTVPLKFPVPHGWFGVGAVGSGVARGPGRWWPSSQPEHDPLGVK